MTTFFYRINNFFIPRAPAKISCDGLCNFFACGFWIVLKQSMSGEDHAGRADAALRAAFA